MKRFIEGEDRFQSTLLPDSLDDYIDEDNPVRAVDAFVDALDLGGLGFHRVQPADTGRPGYHPSILLKLYIYGYLNHVSSSRRLERESQRNVELMWLLGRLQPDFKTIADFRKDNGEAIRKVCREFVELCRRLDLFTQALVAVDGSKFKAVNNRDKSHTTGKMKKRLEQIDRCIDRYLRGLERADRDSSDVAQAKAKRLSEKITVMRNQAKRLQQIEKQLLAHPDKQISETDPDARSMATSGRGTGIVGYNVQVAAEAKHHLIVHHEVTNVGHDRNALSDMSIKSRTAMQVDDLDVVADRGYFKGEEILACHNAGITAYLPKPKTSTYESKGMFTKQDFRFCAEDNEYECPAGKRMRQIKKTVKEGMVQRTYANNVCPQCHLKSTCTTARQRTIARWEHEHILDAVQERLDRHPEKMRERKQTVEHVFGNIKFAMGARHFLMKTMKHVKTEMSLHVLSYNLTRVINILGVPSLVKALQA
jgi:transposase